MSNTVFDFVTDISYTKEYTLNESNLSVYVPFIVNKAFMQSMDTVLYVSELNKMGTVSKTMHHDFLFYSIPPRKRYEKWAKADDSIDLAIDNICAKYKVNRSHAIAYYALMSDELKQKFNKEKVKGGKR